MTPAARDTAIPDIPFDSSDWFEMGEPEYPLADLTAEQQAAAKKGAAEIEKRMAKDGMFPLDDVEEPAS